MKGTHSTMEQKLPQDLEQVNKLIQETIDYIDELLKEKKGGAK